MSKRNLVYQIIYISYIFRYVLSVLQLSFTDARHKHSRIYWRVFYKKTQT